MWSGWLTDSTIPALEQSISFAQRRHTLLAGNIANLDVPGYRTRDLSVEDFQQALQSSIAAHRTSEHWSPGMPSPQVAAEKVRDVQHQVLFHDGSDVGLEQQVTEISRNQLMHDTAIAPMRSQFQTLQVAIRDRLHLTPWGGQLPGGGASPPLTRSVRIFVWAVGRLDCPARVGNPGNRPILARNSDVFPIRRGLPPRSRYES